MGQYADLFARIVDAEQDMPDLMAGEAEALEQVKTLVSDLNGSQYTVEFAYSENAGMACLRVSDMKGDIAVIPFKIVTGDTTPELALYVGWGSGEARFNLANETGCRRAAETIAQETLGQLHNATRFAATMRRLDV